VAGLAAVMRLSPLQISLTPRVGERLQFDYQDRIVCERGTLLKPAYTFETFSYGANNVCPRPLISRYLRNSLFGKRNEVSYEDVCGFQAMPWIDEKYRAAGLNAAMVLSLCKKFKQKFLYVKATGDNIMEYFCDDNLDLLDYVVVFREVAGNVAHINGYISLSVVDFSNHRLSNADFGPPLCTFDRDDDRVDVQDFSYVCSLDGNCTGDHVTPEPVSAHATLTGVHAVCQSYLNAWAMNANHTHDLSTHIFCPLCNVLYPIVPPLPATVADTRGIPNPVATRVLRRAMVRRFFYLRTIVWVSPVPPPPSVVAAHRVVWRYNRTLVTFRGDSVQQSNVFESFHTQRYPGNVCNHSGQCRCGKRIAHFLCGELSPPDPSYEFVVPSVTPMDSVYLEQHDEVGGLQPRAHCFNLGHPDDVRNHYFYVPILPELLRVPNIGMDGTSVYSGLSFIESCNGFLMSSNGPVQLLGNNIPLSHRFYSFSDRMNSLHVLDGAINGDLQNFTYPITTPPPPPVPVPGQPPLPPPHFTPEYMFVVPQTDGTFHTILVPVRRHNAVVAVLCAAGKIDLSKFRSTCYRMIRTDMSELRCSTADLSYYCLFMYTMATTKYEAHNRQGVVTMVDWTADINLITMKMKVRNIEIDLHRVALLSIPSKLFPKSLFGLRSGPALTGLWMDSPVNEWLSSGAPFRLVYHDLMGESFTTWFSNWYYNTPILHSYFDTGRLVGGWTPPRCIEEWVARWGGETLYPRSTGRPRQVPSVFAWGSITTHKFKGRKVGRGDSCPTYQGIDVQCWTCGGWAPLKWSWIHRRCPQCTLKSFEPNHLTGIGHDLSMHIPFIPTSTTSVYEPVVVSPIEATEKVKSVRREFAHDTDCAVGCNCDRRVKYDRRGAKLCSGGGSPIECVGYIFPEALPAVFSKSNHNEDTAVKNRVFLQRKYQPSIPALVSSMKLIFKCIDEGIICRGMQEPLDVPNVFSYHSLFDPDDGTPQHFCIGKDCPYMPRPGMLGPAHVLPSRVCPDADWAFFDSIWDAGMCGDKYSFTRSGWIDSFKPSRRRAYVAEMKRFLVHGLDNLEKGTFKSFIKRELAATRPRLYTTVFPPENPRLIQPPQDRTHLVAGRFMKAATKKLHTIWGLDDVLCYAGGLHPHQMDAWAARHMLPNMANVSSEKHYIENDFTAYDCTYSEELFDIVVYPFYKRLGLLGERGSETKEQQDLFRVLRHWSRPTGVMASGATYKGVTMNASGRDDTALMNALCNGLCQFAVFTSLITRTPMDQLHTLQMDVMKEVIKKLNVIVLGDDSVTVVDRCSLDGLQLFDGDLAGEISRLVGLWGFEAKPKIRTKFSEVVFLGSRPWPATHHATEKDRSTYDTVIWGPTIGRRIFKLGTMAKQEGHPLAWLAGVALSSMMSYPHVPIIRDICMSILEKTHRWEVAPTPFLEEVDHYNPTRSMRFHGEVTPNEYTYQMLNELYGVDLGDLVDLDNQMKSSDFFPMLLCTNATYKAITTDDL
jgi:hypothetical protein